MFERSDESLFAAYLKSHDVDALGTLFERRATELLRLAVFLAPRTSDAEDLVQATFLAAISNADQFRAGNRVMPWLCGILTNHARMLRRAGKRQQPEAKDQVTDDPSETALQREIKTALARGIENLAEPYRSVLNLHLAEGLDCTEIGDRLDRAPATVRKQMERGLGHLRTALPIGLASSLVCSVRAATLARDAAEAARYVPLPPPAAAPTDPAAGDGVLGVPTAKLAMLTAAVVAVAATAWLWLSPPAMDSAPPPAPIASVDAGAAEPAAALAATAPAGMADDPIGPARTQPLGPPAVTIEVVDREGRAVADAAVSLTPLDGTSYAERTYRGDGAVTRTTDATGLVAFDGLAPGIYDLGQPGGMSRQRLVLADSAVRRQLRIARPITLRGVVTAADGRALAGAEIVASESALRADSGTVIATSRDDGSFVASCPLPSGRVYARVAGMALSPGQRIDGGADLRLVVPATARPLAVTVCDANGSPLADAFVAYVPPNRSASAPGNLYSRTDATGVARFVVGDGSARVFVRHRAFAAADATIAPTTATATITLQPGGALTGRATDAAQQPIVGRAVVVTIAGVEADDPTGNLMGREATTDRDGRFRIDGLPPGPAQVRVHGRPLMPDGMLPIPHILASRDVTIAADAPAACDLQAHAGHELRGRLRTSNGTPIAGWNVLAVPVDGYGVQRALRSRGATTDAEGRFTLVDCDLVDYRLGAMPSASERGPDPYLPFATTAARPDAAAALLVADATALPQSQVRLVALDELGQPLAGCDVELLPQDFPWTTMRVVGADGTVTFQQVPAGRYVVSVLGKARGTRSVAIAVPDDGSVVDLGTVTVTPPAEITVRVVDEATRLPRAGVRLTARHALGDRRTTAVTDADGWARLTQVALPAQLLAYGPGVTPLRRDLGDSAGSPTSIELLATPGATVAVDFEHALADNPFTINGPLHWRIADATGRVVVDDLAPCLVPGRFQAALDLPAGNYRLEARAPWSGAAATEFAVAAGSAAPTLALRLSR